MKKYWLILIPVGMIVAGQTLAKLGVQRLQEDNRIVNIFIIGGYFLLILRGVAWVWIVRKVKLSVAYPFISITYVFVLLISYYFFNESLGIRKVLGALLVMTGIFFVGYGELKNKQNRKGER